MYNSIVIAALFLASSVCGLENGLARTPPMGWMSWERFRCITDCATYPDQCLSENLIKAMADRLSTDGYKEAGYEYVIIDDCWPQKQRDAHGNLVPDPVRFPNGMKAVGDYIHSKGLKFGIYGDFGTLTCGGYPGVEFHMQQDANTFASWGVDYVKLDGCYSATNQMVEGYETFGFFLNQTDRPIVYSCSWPAYQMGHMNIDSTALIKTCNLWRIFGDIQDSWSSVTGIIGQYAANPQNFTTWGGPGHWNDPDMVIVGDFGLSYVQQQTQMAMWSIFAAPLILSSDLRTIRNESKSLLLNTRVLAINQDPLGIQGTLLYKRSDGIQVWIRKLHGNTRAIAFLSMGSGGTMTRVTYKLSDLGLSYADNFAVNEVFSGRSLGTFTKNDSLSCFVSSPGVCFLLAKPGN